MLTKDTTPIIMGVEFQTSIKVTGVHTPPKGSEKACFLLPFFAQFCVACAPACYSYVQGERPKAIALQPVTECLKRLGHTNLQTFVCPRNCNSNRSKHMLELSYKDVRVLNFICAKQRKSGITIIYPTYATFIEGVSVTEFFSAIRRLEVYGIIKPIRHYQNSTHYIIPNQHTRIKLSLKEAMLGGAPR